MKKKFVPALVLFSLTISLPASAQRSSIEEIDPPGNREAYEECKSEGRDQPNRYNPFGGDACWKEFPHTRQTGIPATVDTALCIAQPQQRNPDVIRICEEEGGFTYDWEAGRVVRGSTALEYRNLTVVNNSDFDMVSLTIYSSNFSPDPFTRTLNPPLRAGQSRTVSIPKDVCTYSFSGHTSDHQTSNAIVFDTCAGIPLVFVTEIPPPPRPPQAPVDPGPCPWTISGRCNDVPIPCAMYPGRCSPP